MKEKGWLAGLLVIALVAVVCWRLVREHGDDGATSGRDDAPRVLESPEVPAPEDVTGTLAIAPRPEPSPLGDARGEAAPESPAVASIPASLPDSIGEAVHVIARIVDAGGAPLAGARVFWLHSEPTRVAAGQLPPRLSIEGVYEPPAELGPHGLASLPQAVTGADGRVALDTRHVPIEEHDADIGEEASPRPSLIVVRDGWTSRTVSVARLAGGTRDLGDVALEPEARLTGRVVDESGRPLAGTSVRLESQWVHPGAVKEADFSQQMHVPELTSQLTGADGRFTLSGLWQGQTSLQFVAPDCVHRRLTCKPVAGGTLDLGDVAVLRGSAVAGRVLDEGGAPIAGAKVSVADGEIHGGLVYDVGYGYQDGDDSIHDELAQAEHNRDRPPVLTDATGAFRVGALDNPKVSVYAEADGFEPGRLRPVSTGAADLRVILRREATLHVTVVDRATRKPLPDAIVQVVRESGVDAPRADVTLRTDAGGSGSFVAHGAGPRKNRVVATAPGHGNSLLEAPGVQPAQTADVVVELGPQAVLAGHVRDPKGAPVPGATVTLRAPGQARFAFLQVACDADGAFRIERLSALAAELVAFAPHWPDSKALPIQLADGEQRENLDVRLPAPAAIRGTILSPDGTPNPRARASLDVPPFGEFKFTELSDRFVGYATADEQGRYAFEALAAGDYKVEVAGTGSAECTLAEGEDRVIDFRAQSGVHIHGRVTAAGKPVPGVWVQAGRPRGSEGEGFGWVKPATTDADGAYALDLRTGGDVALTARCTGGRESDPVTLHVQPGADVVADIALPAGHIAGRVVDDVTGAPVPGLEVTLYHRDNVDTAYCSTAADGSFRLDWLPADVYRLRLSGRGQIEGEPYGPRVVELAPLDIIVGEGAAVDDVVLSVCRGATLDGAARLADGSAMQDGVIVQLVRLDHGAIVPGKSEMTQSGGDHGDDSVLIERDKPIWRDVRTKGGRYAFVALPAGEYRVLVGKATADEVRDQGAPVIVGEHESAHLDLVAR